MSPARQVKEGVKVLAKLLDDAVAEGEIRGELATRIQTIVATILCGSRLTVREVTEAADALADLHVRHPAPEAVARAIAARN